MKRFIAIMAGGVGSRFWPASTEEKPKQFLDILGIGKSLIRMTFERCANMVPIENIFVVTNKRYKKLVQNHLPEILESNILCEPSMNNTAPAIAYTSLKISAIDAHASFAVLPSDHVILKEEMFLEILEKAFLYTEKHQALVTLGIKPTRPDTGYGYIKFDRLNITNQDVEENDVYKVTSFQEKPALVLAEKYLKEGDYLWNAGMFIWSVQSILDAFEKYASQITKILSQNLAYLNTIQEQDYIDDVYPKTDIISIDYAIMEHADNVYTIPADIGWSDLGTWNSLHGYLSTSDDQVIVGKQIHLIDCKDIIVMSNNDKKIVIKGLSDYIVVDEDQALLIYPKSQEQEIKDVVKKFNSNVLI